jgi:type IV secretory pathway VirB4 component
MRTLNQWGFRADDPEGWAARRAHLPVLADLAATLAAEATPESQGLADLLAQYAVGLYADLFNTRTTLDLSREQGVVFGLRAVRENAERSLAPVFAWQALRLVWNEIVALGGAQRAHLVVDEAWYLLEQPGAARRLEHFARSFPKYNAALHLATHEADKLLALPEAALLAQLARVKILFGQESDRAVRALADLFGLSAGEAAELRRARQGEALLLIGHEWRVPLVVTIPPARLAHWATNPVQQQAVARASGRAARPVV